MKRRHVLLGLSMVLVICLAVPALGEPLGLRGSGGKSIKAMAKKALKAANAAQATANSALSAANAAKATATTADGGAKTASAAAKTAGDAAKGAGDAAKAAAKTATDATTAANNAATAAQTAQTTASAASNAAQARYGFQKVFRHGEEVAPQAFGTVEVFCPGGSTLTGGGVAIPTGFPDVKASAPNVGDNGWAVTVRTHDETTEVIASAVCVSPNPFP
jgi:hypothetical protein